jgi:hypothetical protein
VLSVTGDRILFGREYLVEGTMNIPGHPHDKSHDSVRRFLGFSEGLLRPHRRVAAVRDVFFVDFAAVVLIDVPSVEHSLSKGDVMLIQANKEIDIKDGVHLLRDCLQVVESHRVEAGCAGWRHRNAN